MEPAKRPVSIERSRLEGRVAASAAKELDAVLIHVQTLTFKSLHFSSQKTIMGQKRSKALFGR